jgi:hypothetical protein
LIATPSARQFNGLGLGVRLTPFDPLSFTLTGSRHQVLPLVVRHAPDELQRRADQVFHGRALRGGQRRRAIQTLQRDVSIAAACQPRIQLARSA